MKNDVEASIFLCCLHLLEALLECKFHVVHVGRMSNQEAELADHKSRLETIREDDRKLAAGVEQKQLTGALAEWLERPVPDWNLPNRLALEVEHKLN